MNIKGIIAEFDPFHNGHKHIISQMKRDNSAVVVALGGNFLQRGEPSLFTKRTRTLSALSSGADLVLEIPTPWSCAPAHNFAMGGVSILQAVGVTEICFGAECSDIEKLTKIADFSENFAFDTKSTEGYAKQRTKNITENLGQEFGKISEHPNNALGIEYIKAGKLLGFNGKFTPVPRIFANHNTDEVDCGIASASKIRADVLTDTDFSELVPSDLFSNYTSAIANGEILNNTKFEISLLSYLRRIPDFGFLPDISEGLQNRIAKGVKNAVSYTELVDTIRSKRYPTSRIKRLLTMAYLDIDCTWVKIGVPYIKVLGVTNIGQEILRNISKNKKTPIIICQKSNIPLDKDAKLLLNKECIRSDIYNSLLNTPRVCATEYTDKLIKKGD